MVVHRRRAGQLRRIRNGVPRGYAVDWAVVQEFGVRIAPVGREIEAVAEIGAELRLEAVDIGVGAVHGEPEAGNVRRYLRILPTLVIRRQIEERVMIQSSFLVPIS